MFCWEQTRWSSSTQKLQPKNPKLLVMWGGVILFDLLFSRRKKTNPHTTTTTPREEDDNTIVASPLFLCPTRLETFQTHNDRLHGLDRAARPRCHAQGACGLVVRIFDRREVCGDEALRRRMTHSHCYLWTGLAKNQTRG